jgi:Tfp pilus assembly protein PilV
MLKKRLLATARGETIVEVLIAIAIAAFAIGTSYAIATRSLQQAITARERNQALNLTQSQIAALKQRLVENPDDFNSDDPTKGFVVRSTTATPSSSQLPYTDFHFCLDDNSASPTDSKNQWARIPNNFSNDNQAADIAPGTDKYNHGNGTNDPGCVRNVDGTNYFIDISAQITQGSVGSANRTVYMLAVRWEELGSGNHTAESIIYYRLPLLKPGPVGGTSLNLLDCNEDATQIINGATVKVNAADGTLVFQGPSGQAVLSPNGKVLQDGLGNQFVKNGNRITCQKPGFYQLNWDFGTRSGQYQGAGGFNLVFSPTLTICQKGDGRMADFDQNGQVIPGTALPPPPTPPLTPADCMAKLP